MADCQHLVARGAGIEFLHDPFDDHSPFDFGVSSMSLPIFMPVWKVASLSRKREGRKEFFPWSHWDLAYNPDLSFVKDYSLISSTGLLQSVVKYEGFCLSAVIRFDEKTKKG